MKILLPNHLLLILQFLCQEIGCCDVIDRMRHWSIVGSVGPLHGPSRRRSHASAGQPGCPEGEDQLGPTTPEPSWAVPPENVPEDPADEPDVLY